MRYIFLLFLVFASSLQTDILANSPPSNEVESTPETLIQKLESLLGMKMNVFSKNSPSEPDIYRSECFYSFSILVLISK